MNRNRKKRKIGRDKEINRKRGKDREELRDKQKDIKILGKSRDGQREISNRGIERKERQKE